MPDDAKMMKTLMLRLEAVTARLEDIAESPTIKHKDVHEVVVSKIDDDLNAPKVATSCLPKGREANAEISEELSESIQAFDTQVITSLTSFTSLSSHVGGIVEQISQLVADGFSEQRNLILTALKCTKPPLDSAEFRDLLQPLQSTLGAISACKESNRASPFFNHLSAVTDGIAVLGWITVASPSSYIGEMKDSAQFYGNRVIKEFKDKDKNHVEWVRSFTNLLSSLQRYVKSYHTTGLSWNARGQDLKTFGQSTQTTAAGSSSTSNLETGSIPPPPPGPPPPPFHGDVLVSSSNQTNDMNSVFAELNKGASVTAGLKKVDQSQMTHKNPSLRSSSTVPESKHSSESKQGAASVARQSVTGVPKRQKPARKELEGTKWIIENYQDAESIVIESVELNQTVYLYNCRNSTIQIKGKFNALSLDSCTKIGVAVDTLVSSIDLVKCSSFAIQVFDKCPTIICDVCESGQLYLSQAGFDCEIVTSKCGSINVNIDSGDGEFREEAVPEMLKHRVVNGKLETSIVVHAD